MHGIARPVTQRTHPHKTSNEQITSHLRITYHFIIFNNSGRRRIGKKTRTNSDSLWHFSGYKQTVKKKDCSYLRFDVFCFNFAPWPYSIRPEPKPLSLSLSVISMSVCTSDGCPVPRNRFDMHKWTCRMSGYMRFNGKKKPPDSLNCKAYCAREIPLVL